MSIEKKFAPLMKVMMRVSVRMRGAWMMRLGNIGYLANHPSQTIKRTIRAAPSRRGTRV